MLGTFKKLFNRNKQQLLSQTAQAEAASIAALATTEMLCDVLIETTYGLDAGKIAGHLLQRAQQLTAMGNTIKNNAEQQMQMYAASELLKKMANKLQARARTHG